VNFKKPSNWFVNEIASMHQDMLSCTDVVAKELAKECIERWVIKEKRLKK
jgi:hypothetical protein